MNHNRLGITACVLCVLGGLMLRPGSAWTEEAKAPPAPLKPGDVRISTSMPEPDKWDAPRQVNPMQRLFKCKPLACPAPESVLFNFSKSPTRHPDPQALEKFANVDLPKSIRAAAAAREVLSDGSEKIETLSSKTATLKGYPAVVNESRLSRGTAVTYAQTAIVFAGPIMIRIQSLSPDQELARKSLDQFIEAMKIEEGPPPEPGLPSPPAGTSSKSQSL
jgi:hypothetical protein